MVAEAASLVGAALRRSPAVSEREMEICSRSPESGAALLHGRARLRHARSRWWSGIVSHHAQPDLRLLDAESQFYGHFHAVAFPGGPFRKGRIGLKDTVDHLFERSHPQGVLHLLRDDRPHARCR